MKDPSTQQSLCDLSSLRSRLLRELATSRTSSSLRVGMERSSSSLRIGMVRSSSSLWIRMERSFPFPAGAGPCGRTRRGFGLRAAGCWERCRGSGSRDWGHPPPAGPPGCPRQVSAMTPDRRLHRLVLAQGLDPPRKHQRLRGVRLTGHHPNQDLQLRAGQI
jgi:hypothetical protein